MDLSEPKEICVCGHAKDNHAHNTDYCLEYPYGNFDNKCTCPCYSPFLTLSNEDDIRDLTGPEDYFKDESPETI